MLLGGKGYQVKYNMEAVGEGGDICNTFHMLFYFVYKNVGE